ncbi:MAG: hypothetical protein ACRDGG_04025 [Anaerolineae bacterium]
MRGTPFKANGRIFAPEARVTTLVAREATLGTHATRVAGIQLTHVRPTALIEQSADGEHRHHIGDQTGRALFGLAAAAAAVPLILNALAGWLGAQRK